MLDYGEHVQPSTVGGGSFRMNAAWNGGGRPVAAEVLWKTPESLSDTRHLQYLTLEIFQFSQKCGFSFAVGYDQRNRHVC